MLAMGGGDGGKDPLSLVRWAQVCTIFRDGDREAV